MKIYLVAGELSGDRLGAALMPQLRAHFPQAEFRGLGGDLMQAEGLTSLYPLETLSVMGLVEVLKHLPQLVRVRRHLYQDALAWGADLILGIDAPDFNLGLEKKLRQKGIKSVHYVSPSVWAWRQGRIKGIKQSCDLMLCLLPFEVDFYRQHQMPAVFVGHPAADRLPLTPDKTAARQQLGLAAEDPVVCLLPGSRGGEVARLGASFLEAAQTLQTWRRQARQPALKFLLPAATPTRRQQLAELLEEQPLDSVQLLDGQADTALQAADAALLASGTVALEALFCKTPMVVSYKVAPLTWWLGRFLLKTPWVSLPNLLAQKELVKERLQNAATPQQLATDLAQLLNNAEAAQHQQQAFLALHKQLRQDASATAAQAIASLLQETPATKNAKNTR